MPQNASTKDIRKAFKEKSLKCHPDKFPGDIHKEKEFKILSEAYQTLSDSSLREQYDLTETSTRGGGSRSSTKQSPYEKYRKQQSQTADFVKNQRMNWGVFGIDF